MRQKGHLGEYLVCSPLGPDEAEAGRLQVGQVSQPSSHQQERVLATASATIEQA